MYFSYNAYIHNYFYTRLDMQMPDNNLSVTNT